MPAESGVAPLPGIGQNESLMILPGLPMTAVTVYHNPRCSKSREALRLLEEAGVTPVVVDYQKTPLTEAGLVQVLRRLGCEARDIMRRDEPEYRELFLDDVTLSEAHLLGAIVEHPRLLQRPIVVAGARAVIARPPSLALELVGLAARPEPA